jgi:CheY-like chemotaxis protein
LNKPLAFVVEDDEALAELFSEALQKAEFEVEVFRDGRAALSRLADAIPALVALDLHLPHVSGLDILNYIRSDSRLSKIRVVLATANPEMAFYVREKADLVLIKPISYIQLRTLAARLRPSDPPLT